MPTWSPSWNAPSPTHAAGSGSTTPLTSARRNGPPSPSAHPTRSIPDGGSPRPTSGNGCTRSTVRAPRTSSSPSPTAVAPCGTSNGSPRASTSCRRWHAPSSPSYGDTPTCYTNVTVGAGKNGTLDFEASHWGYTPMTFYWEDAGLVIVSDTEVGLFWTFDV